MLATDVEHPVKSTFVSIKGVGWIKKNKKLNLKTSSEAKHQHLGLKNEANMKVQKKQLK